MLNAETQKNQAPSRVALLAGGTSSFAQRVCPAGATDWLADLAAGRTQAAPALTEDLPGVSHGTT